ncbi:hypothetical protein FRC10_008731 [Ceratobasidium sp. 414]|nr:hypothetical protein FRC10_008731 [Ceratobasidium sp. 414]
MPPKKPNHKVKTTNTPQQQKSAFLPALLVAIIGIAAVGVFAPDVWGTVASFWPKHAAPGGAPFDVVDIPGRGKGVIANRNIKQGELLIKEKPLFIVPKRLTDRTDPSTLIRTTVSSLSQPDQTSFFALSYAKPNVSAADIPFEIFQTNAISAGSIGTGLFPRTARLNHGCSRAFSAVYYWREEEGVLDNESAASDRRLGLMVDIRSMFAMWGKGDIKGTEAIKLARRIWSIGGTEGYLSERGQLAADAAHVAAGHKDATAVRQWATLAHKWYAIELGPDSEQCRMALRISRTPESHGAWGSRETEQVGGTEDLS